ncbi:MAG: hypothetical protein JWN45_1122, partial [Acidobacteriaceae bacterium]|nr:hypothetical protein [Acidobacteriaceae bacterium]
PAGTDQRLPLAVSKFFGEQDFHLSLQEFFGGRVLWADRLGMAAAPLSKQTSRKDEGVVEYQQVVAAQQGREIAKCAVSKFPAFAVEMEHAGGRAVCQRLLGYPFRRQIVMKLTD